MQSGGFLWLSRGWGGGSLSLSDLSSRAHELLHTQPSESATGVVLRCPDSPVVAPSCRNPGLGTPGLSPTFPTDSPCLSQLPSKSTLPYFLISLMIFFPEALPYMPAFFSPGRRVLTVTIFTERATGWDGDGHHHPTPRGDRGLCTVSGVTGSGVGVGAGEFVVKKVLKNDQFRFLSSEGRSLWLNQGRESDSRAASTPPSTPVAVRSPDGPGARGVDTAPGTRHGPLPRTENTSREKV